MAVLLALLLMAGATHAASALASPGSAASIAEDRTPLRSSCDGDAEVVAVLSAGTHVTIRFALSGEAEPCYKIAAESGGKPVEGYVTAGALKGLAQFDQARRSAAWLDLAHVIASAAPLASATPSAISVPNTGVAGTAVGLIESSQPNKALALLEPQVESHNSPGLLALAGIAAWRADDDSKALEYWRASLDLQPNPDLESLYRRIQREARNDHSSEKLYGMKVMLRYDPAAVSTDTAREMTAALDHEFLRISGELGCSAEERIVAIVQSPEAYRKSTDAAEWNGGEFDGRIRVPVSDGQGMTAAMHRTLAHEMTHACLSMMGNWPSWLQEGLAQKLSGDTVTPALREKLAAWARAGRLPKLSNLHQDWSRLDTDHAMAAYGLALEAVEMLYQDYGADGIRNLLHNPERLPQITADLDRRLGL
jgi:hypothetical protein